MFLSLTLIVNLSNINMHTRKWILFHTNYSCSRDKICTYANSNTISPLIWQDRLLACLFVQCLLLDYHSGTTALRYMWCHFLDNYISFRAIIIMTRFNRTSNSIVVVFSFVFMSSWSCTSLHPLSDIHH